MLEDVYPLTPLQEGLYYHWLRSGNAEVYLDQISYSVRGTLDMDVLKNSYHLLAERHAVLRTFFTHNYGDKPLQIVRRDILPAFEYRHETALDDQALARIRRTDRLKGFDLNRGSQMRLLVLYTGENRYELIWTYHHILMDGWCMSILIKEFLQIYYSLLKGEDPVLARVYPFSGYLKWLTARDGTGSLTYWKNYLSGYSNTTGLPKLAASDTVIPGGITKQVMYLDGDLRRKLKDRCAEWRITENTFLQTAWGILLARYNQTNDVVFGAVVSGRPPELEGVEEMIGLFINNIPIRIRWNTQTTVRDLLRDVQQNFVQGASCHYIQLADIQTASGNGSGLFDHILVFENYPVQDVIPAQTGSAEPGQTSSLQLIGTTSFQENSYDLTLTIVPSDSIRVDFSYNVGVYDASLIRRLQGHFAMIIEQMLQNPLTYVDAVNYLTQDELTWLTNAATSTMEVSRPDETVLHRFRQHAVMHPSAIAVACEDRTMTYGELDELTGLLSHYLFSCYNLGAGDLVGLRLGRSEQLIVALWGILRSGAAYLPLDPTWPEARIDEIIKESKCRCVIDDTFMSRFMEKRHDIVAYSQDIQVSSKDLAYVIYTSGSTGSPKGVMISHKALMDYCDGLLNATSLSSCSSFGWVSTIAADLGNTVLFPALITGGKLQVYTEKELLQPATLCQRPVECLKIVPSHWKALQGRDTAFLPSKCLLFGGEPLTGEVLRLLSSKNASCTIYNHYGPSETTVGKLLRIIRPDDSGKAISLGYPFGNNQVFIMDHQLRLTGIGITGEICISGTGLSDGYLGQSALTDQRFVSHPLYPGQRIYRTGDLGRWLSDGSIEFLGRKDEQVKIRGYRVEPGEIAHQISNFRGITGAVVIPQPVMEDDVRLVAYFTAGTIIDHAALQSALARSLPAHMVPADYIQLDHIPLTGNGKIDKRALPLANAPASSVCPQARPLNVVEERLASIWSDVLGVESHVISAHTNFFDLGGHSLTAIRTILRIREQFGLDIDVPQFFDSPVIEAVAQNIEQGLRLKHHPEQNSITTIIV